MKEKVGQTLGPLLVGLFAGVTLAVVVGGLWSWTRMAATQGLQYGFGIGFGGIVALVGLNRLVGYLDRIASGKG